MPQHSPEDRVRVRNIVDTRGEDDVKTFTVTRYRKEPTVTADGREGTRDVPFEKEIDWNFRNGFFFSWGGKYYALRPGEEKTYPRFIAEHCAKHMCDYVLHREMMETRTRTEDGLYRYDENILRDPNRRKRLMDRAIVGVEEWADGNDDDFDTALARQFGGDFDAVAEERVSREDYELPGLVEQDEPAPARKTAAKPLKPTADPELAKLRDEAARYGIEPSESDTADSLKARIVKEMA